jgi:hypothetical protein
MHKLHNKRPAVDAGMALRFAFVHLWPGTTEADRWARSVVQQLPSNPL